MSAKNALYISILFAFPITLFFIFYLKWIHLEHDVGREMYQAFAIATQGKVLYTELTHFFGPLAPYSNALFLKIFGSTIFNFSLIGLILTILSGLLLYLIGSYFLSKSLSFIGTILFISLAAINEGGGSFFMPYSYAHSYGIVLSLVILLFLINYKNTHKLLFLLTISITTSLLLFTKQEYVFVFALVHFILLFDFIKHRFWKRFLIYSLGTLSLNILFYNLLFIDYSLIDLWDESRNMFQNHNQSILHNFLMLYSPSTLKLALILSIPIVLFVLLFSFTNQKYALWKIGFGTLIMLFFGYLFLQTIHEEFLHRAFVLNWITLLSAPFLIYQNRKTKLDLSPILMVILVSIALYNRQQSASWMWQGLNILVLIFVLKHIFVFLKLRESFLISGILGLIIVSLFLIPSKLKVVIQKVCLRGRCPLAS